MRKIAIHILLVLTAVSWSCSNNNPVKSDIIDGGEGTIAINVHFPEEYHAKISSAESATAYAYVYIYLYDEQFTSRRKLQIFDKTAGTMIKLQAGTPVICKVMGFDGRQNMTYQGKSQKVVVSLGQTTVMDIMMAKSGFVTIPAGSFEMGSDDGLANEKPVHTVTLDAFEISATEITKLQWAAVVPWYIPAGEIAGVGDDSHPASSLSWFYAVEFCNRLSEFSGLQPCYDESTYECDFSKSGYRLPTEAEWEYACRAGTTTAYNTGDSVEDLDRAAWYGHDPKDVNYNIPVGDKEPNAWGLYDMHGNVSEWCNDVYDSGYYSTTPETNPTGPEGSNRFVVRGGYRHSDEFSCRSAARSSDRGNSKKSIIGFRIVRRVNR